MEINKDTTIGEILEKAPLEDFVELKIEVDDLINKIDDILEICETSLNS